MIAYIDLYRDQFGVELICRTLGATAGGFLSSRGYRAAKTRPVSARALRDRELVEQVRAVHAANYGVYGAPNAWHVMVRQGWLVGRDQVARLMRQAGLAGVTRGRKPRTTAPAPVPDGRPDLVDRCIDGPINDLPSWQQFVEDVVSAAAPNRLWVADITYVRTTSGFCYIAFVTDVFSRKIAGWATRSTLRTDDLPLEALEHALISAQDHALKDLIHHSDRGSQYVSIRYTERLAAAGITGSLGTVGDSYDTALAETVNGLYKTELIHARTPALGHRGRVRDHELGPLVEHPTPSPSPGLRHPSRDRGHLLSSKSCHPGTHMDTATKPSAVQTPRPRPRALGSQ